jgi:hypothetical protein
MADKVDGRGKHPNSRAALVPGGKVGVRVRITKDFVLEMTEWLTDNRAEFVARMSQLSDKDWVAAYQKMMDMLVPKQQDITLHEGPPASVFQINFGAPTPERQQALLDAQHTLDSTPEPDEDPIDFDNLFNLPSGDENGAHDE